MTKPRVTRLTRWSTFGLVVLSVAGCSWFFPPPASPTGRPGDEEPIRAADDDGPFELTFELPRVTWTSTEAIEGESRLARTGEGGMHLFGSGGGLLAFAFGEVGGSRVMEPIWTADCAAHAISSEQPLTSPVTKSGGWSADDPDAAFYKDFFADPDVRLPAGEWDITAVALFVEGDGCSGPSHELRATIRVRVFD